MDRITTRDSGRGWRGRDLEDANHFSKRFPACAYCGETEGAPEGNGEEDVDWGGGGRCCCDKSAHELDGESGGRGE
ncbi:hypothetical protein BC829DRAFT_406663, partial [Chytridium lagenaria]